MSRHPAKSETVAVLLETAGRAAMDSNAEHPEDVACEMANAVEHAAIALLIAHQRATA